MRFSRLAAFLLACCPVVALARGPSIDLRDLDDLPLHSASAFETAKAIAAAQDADKGQGPALFAATVELPLGLGDGRWDTLDSGERRWRTRVYSAGARALLLQFGRFTLPDSATLWIYDDSGRTLQGPYGARDRNVDGGLWTAMVPGETAVIELRVDATQQDAVQLRLARLGHAYRNARDLDAGGACNVDTACSLGNGWRNEIRSTVKLQIPSGLFVGLCSGTLVNNAAQDDKPYVLTADHCGIGTFGSPASGVVAYFNFENSTCGGAADAGDTQTISGATLRADDRTTDFTLIEMNSAPPRSFNVYYAGWDAGGSGGASGVGIHHPGGDAKKISAFNTALTATDVQIQTGGPQIPAWQVQRWSEGTTEQGSSGSALWNQDHRIVGTLSGGSAACVGNVDNDQSDFYARLDRQWQARGTAGGQLKAWLAPDSDCTAIDGKNPGTAAALTCRGGTTGGATTGGGSGGGSGGATSLPLLFGLLGLLSLRRRAARNDRQN